MQGFTITFGEDDGGQCLHCHSRTQPVIAPEFWEHDLPVKDLPTPDDGQPVQDYVKGRQCPICQRLTSLTFERAPTPEWALGEPFVATVEVSR